jgi:hypothetical protein
LRIYLRDLLPARFSVGNGMIYSPSERSHETDIVIWDSCNFPRLQMLGHSLYFAESVKAVLEVKSRWSEVEWQNVRMKTEAVRKITTNQEPNLNEQLALIELKLKTSMSNTANTPSNHQIYHTRHPIGSNAIFFRGGDALLDSDPTSELIDVADNVWPDTILLLQFGGLVRKLYSDDYKEGLLHFYELGEDALLAFTHYLHAQTIERSVYVDDPLYLWKYVDGEVPLIPKRIVKFPLLQPVPSLTGSWDEA